MSMVDQIEGLLREERPLGYGMFRNGLVLAEVVNIEDPDKLNRIKCKPVGEPDEAITDWCYFMGPMSGSSCGVFFPPQVKDLVVLGYLNGDPHRPIVLGGYWNNERKAPFAIEKGVAQDYVVRTPNQIDLTLHDEKDKQTVTLTMPSGAQLKLDDEKQTAVLQDKGGKNTLTFNFKNGEASLSGEKKLVLSAGSTTITLESSGNLTLKCSGKLSMEGGSIAGKAQGQLSLQGATAQMKGDGTAEVSASGSTTIKGGIVKIN